MYVLCPSLDDCAVHTRYTEEIVTLEQLYQYLPIYIYQLPVQHHSPRRKPRVPSPSSANQIHASGKLSQMGKISPPQVLEKAFEHDVDDESFTSAVGISR